MKKYCTKCKQSFDFQIKRMSDLDNLVCPVCNSRIDKDSNPPVDNTYSDKTVNAIGNTFRVFATINYFFFVTLAIVGIAAFFLKLDRLLFVMTGICVVTFLIQTAARICTFRSGLIFLPIGAVAGYLIFRTIQGTCLGVLAVFLIRHLLRDLLFSLIGKLIGLASK